MSFFKRIGSSIRNIGHSIADPYERGFKKIEKGAEKAVHFVKEHPLEVGAAVLGAAAIVGTAGLAAPEVLGAEAAVFGGAEVAAVGAEAAAVGAEAAVGGAELAEVGAVSLEAPEVLASDFLSVADVSVLPEAEIQQVESFTLPELIESDFMAVPDIAELEVPELAELEVPELEPVEDIPMYSDAEINQFVEEEFGAEVEEVGGDEMVERRVDLSDWDYRQLPEELEQNTQNIMSKMEEIQGTIEEKIEGLKGMYNEAYNYVKNIYETIKDTKLFRIGNKVVKVGTIMSVINWIQSTIKKGEQIRDLAEEIPKILKDEKKDDSKTPEKTPIEPTNEGKLTYNEMISLVKTYNNKQETIEFLAKHKEEYDDLSQEQKDQLLLLARQNF